MADTWTIIGAVAGILLLQTYWLTRALDASLDAISKRLDRIERRLELIEERVAGIESRVARLEGSGRAA